LNRLLDADDVVVSRCEPTNDVVVLADLQELLPMGDIHAFVRGVVAANAKNDPHPSSVLVVREKAGRRDLLL
jgi:hypothetical protein